MPNTVRTEAELLALYADNTSGDISPQDLRDGVVSTDSVAREQRTQTQTIDTDPDTFETLVTVDLGRAGTAVITLTLLATTPDGETFGLGGGKLVVSKDFSTPETSFDGVTWVTGSAINPGVGGTNRAIDASMLANVGDVSLSAYFVYRYVRFNVSIIDTNYALYAGANHPTAQVRIDVEKL